MSPSLCLFVGLDALPCDGSLLTPPETVGGGRPLYVEAEGGASCSGTNGARALPLSSTGPGEVAIPGWVKPGMFSSSRSSSSSAKLNQYKRSVFKNIKKSPPACINCELAVRGVVAS